MHTLSLHDSEYIITRKSKLEKMTKMNKRPAPGGDVIDDVIHFGKKLKKTEKSVTPIFGTDGLVDFQVTAQLKKDIINRAFVEVYDMLLVDRLLFHTAFAHRNQNKNQLQKESRDRLKWKRIESDSMTYLKSCMEANQWSPFFQYKLEHSRKVESMALGRLYDRTHKAVMYMSNRLRSVLFKDLVEVDQKSCHPRIFIQVYKGLFGHEPEIAARIVAEKVTLYPQFAQALSCSVSDIKLVVNSILYGGGVQSILGDPTIKKSNDKQRIDQERNELEEKTPPLLKRFKGEVQQVLQVVTQKYSAQYEVLRQHRGSSKVDWSDRTRTLSYILQEVETAITAHALSLMIEWGCTRVIKEGIIASLVHDGVYISPTDKEVDLEELSKRVSSRVGFKVTFGFKRVNPGFTPDELRALNEIPATDITKKRLAAEAFGLTNHRVVVKQRAPGQADVTMELWDGRPVMTQSFFTTDQREREIQTGTWVAHRDAKVIFKGAKTIDMQLPKPSTWLSPPAYVKFQCEQGIMAFIKAGMNSGKSYNAFKEAAKLGECVYIAPTISLVESAITDALNEHGLRLGDYRDKKNKDHRRVATTVDSLCTIEAGAKLIIIDEASKVVDQLTSSTMDKAPKQRVDALSKLAELFVNADHVFVLDADLTSHEVEFFRNNRPPSMSERCIYYASPLASLSYRFTVDKAQAYSKILQHVFVKREPVVVPCSTVREALNVEKLVLDYVNGEINLYGAKVKRTVEDVLGELMEIHQEQDRHVTIGMINEIVTGVAACTALGSKLPVDMRKDVRAARKSLINDKDGVTFMKHRECVLAGDTFVMVPLRNPKKITASILAYSPCVSVGMSFKTKHYKLCMSLFSHAVMSATVLLQMTNRFRKIKKIIIYAGNSKRNELDIEKLEKNAAEFVARIKKEDVDSDISDTFVKLYKHKFEQARLETCPWVTLQETLTRAIMHSNPFNTVNVLLEATELVESAGDQDEVALDFDNPDVYNAKEVTEDQFKTATADEKARFNMVNRMFPNNQVPNSLKPDTIKTWVNNYKACKFTRDFIDRFGVDPAKVPDSTWEYIRDRSLQNKVDLHLLLQSLGFNSGEHLLKWASRGREKVPMRMFAFDAAAVSAVIERLGLFNKMNPKRLEEMDPVEKTYRCSLKLLRHLCPDLGKCTTSNAEIHGKRVRTKYVVNVELLEFTKAFLKGENKAYEPPVKPPKAQSNGNYVTRMACSQSDNLGTLGMFKLFS